MDRSEPSEVSLILLSGPVEIVSIGDAPFLNYF